jgi:hypothetical protein
VQLDHITQVQDLVERDIAHAVATREGTGALLSRLVEVSKPETGTAKVLLVLARLATMACDWIDGDMVVDLVDEGLVTRVEVATEMGGGMRERVFAPLRLAAPMAEFTRAIERVPHMIRPLAVRSRSDRRLTFAASAMVRRTTSPPPPVEIASESLYVRAPAPALPTETDAPSLPVVSSRAPESSSEAEIDEGWE